MNIETRVIRDKCCVKIGVTVDGIDCGSVTVAGTTDPNQQYLLDALAEGRMNAQDFWKAVGFEP